jgi:lysophospholipase L1-like esterase
MNCRSRRGLSSSSTEQRPVAVFCAGLGLLLAFGCSSADDAPDDDASGGSGKSGSAGTTATGGKAGTTAAGGKAGSSSGGAGSGTAGTSGSGGKAQGGQGSSGDAGQSGGAGAPAGGAGSGGEGNDGGTSGLAGGGSGAGSGGAGSGGAGAGGSAGATGEAAVHYVGRVDTSNPDSVRFAWSGAGAVVRFNGTSLGVELAGGQEYTVVVDDVVQPKLTAETGMNELVTGLTAGEHVVELYRRTEASQGESTILGFDLGGGELLPPLPVTRRLEFIGDSITCGYGNEGADMNCPFSPETENHYLAYAALTARSLGAELSTVAWSGKGVVCNYGDESNSCTNPLPTYYDRILPDRADSTWDFSLFQPDAVVINLGTNDFSTDDDPDQPTFEGAYRDLLERVRENYPTAHILCTNGPMLSDTDLSTVRMYLENVVATLGDPKISTFEIEPQDGDDGYGCDWHPSLVTHEKMATVVTAALKSALDWP